ncbi:hypothetical protein [Aliiroseovarius halocynthiae]|uniref:hypothetical protein n=1 Tax=Aliiroseovarius halocynthiae TaxID=985055 RepID=UPI0024B7733C|nr:hypothetical protein [Aliiroseovarius halocynthiae]
MSNIGSSRPTLKHRFCRFCENESGTVTVESVIILPLLFFALMAFFAFFDAFRKQSLALRANYAISDYLSRVYKYDRKTFNGVDKLFRYMSNTGNESWIRVSVVHCAVEKDKCNNADDPDNVEKRELTFLRANSAASLGAEANGGKVFADTAEMLKQLGGRIPNMYEGEYLFVVETHARFKPIFPTEWTGLHETFFHNTVVTSTREYEFLCFEKPGKVCKDPDA